MTSTNNNTEMLVTELRRAGDGALEDSSVAFKFTGNEHSAPLDEIEMHLKTNTSRHELPGGNDVVEHVMASTWQPFDVHGEWNDMWGNRFGGGIIRTGAYAFTMYQEFAEMVSRGSFVRLEIDALSFVGLITDLYLTYRTKSRIAWKFTISPHQNNTVKKTRRPDRGLKLQSIPKWIEDMKTRRDELDDLFGKAKKLSFKTPQIDDFTRHLLDINDALDRLQGIGSDSFHTDTTDKLLLMATTFRRLGGAAQQGWLALNRVASPFNIAYQSVLQSVKHAEWISSTATSLAKTIGLSRTASLDMNRRAGKKPRAIYYPKAGESLERISVRFYGTAASWRLIYDANNLSSLVLSGTEELVIPGGRV